MIKLNPTEWGPLFLMSQILHIHTIDTEEMAAEAGAHIAAHITRQEL